MLVYISSSTLCCTSSLHSHKLIVTFHSGPSSSFSLRNALFMCRQCRTSRSESSHPVSQLKCALNRLANARRDFCNRVVRRDITSLRKASSEGHRGKSSQYSFMSLMEWHWAPWLSQSSSIAELFSLFFLLLPFP